MLLLSFLLACGGCGSSTVAPPPEPEPPAPPPQSEVAPPAEAEVRKREGEEPPWLPTSELPLAPAVAEAAKRMEARDPAGALAALDPWIAGEGKDDALAALWKGRALGTQGQLAEAEAELRRGGALAPQDFVLRQELADLLVGTRRCAEAVPLLEAQTKAHPELAPTWTNLGFCRMRADQEEQGYKDLSRGCELGHERACMMKKQAEARGLGTPAPG